MNRNEKNFNTTLTSTTQINVSGLGRRESGGRYRKEGLPFGKFAPDARGCERRGRASILTASPKAFYSLRGHWRRAWILFASRLLYDDPNRSWLEISWLIVLRRAAHTTDLRSEEHTSELQSPMYL